MAADRPIVMSIAGFDPSAGAGILADIKTCEQHKVYGIGVSTAQTLQTEHRFEAIRWEEPAWLLHSIATLLQQYPVQAIKIGIVEDLVLLKQILQLIRQQRPSAKLVLDTVMKSSTGFDFWHKSKDQSLLKECLSYADLITPNYEELQQLLPGLSIADAALQLSHICPVLLKGGHNEASPGIDYLYTKEGLCKIETSVHKLPAKHGSGCVLSAAIAANWALGKGLEAACRAAKRYTEQFLSSNTQLLGYHEL